MGFLKFKKDNIMSGKIKKIGQVIKNVFKIKIKRKHVNTKICKEELRNIFIRGFPGCFLTKNIIKLQKYYKELNIVSKNNDLLSYVHLHMDELNWELISGSTIYGTLSEAFIREFQNKVWWEIVSQRQILSEDFIEEFQYKVDWHHIFYNQVLSDEFRLKFINKPGSALNPNSNRDTYHIPGTITVALPITIGSELGVGGESIERLQEIETWMGSGINYRIRNRVISGY